MTSSRLCMPSESWDDDRDTEDGLPEFDDEPWEVFEPDDDQEPVPEPGDFWVETDANALSTPADILNHDDTKDPARPAAATKKATGGSREGKGLMESCLVEKIRLPGVGGVSDGNRASISPTESPPTIKIPIFSTRQWKGCSLLPLLSPVRKLAHGARVLTVSNTKIWKKMGARHERLCLFPIDRRVLCVVLVYRLRKVAVSRCTFDFTLTSDHF